MPGLLDLPPELLEQIYDEYHEETYWDDSAHLGDLRLTCRYVEKSIRRRFLINECSETAVKTFEEASIQKFRAMSSASEFAKAVKCVKLVLYDDSTIVPQNGTLQQRPRDTDASSAGNPDSSGDLKTVAQAPLLYHEDGILKALRACGNINELQFLALGPDPKALHHDMTSTFGFVLSLLVRAGIYPTHIGMIRNLGVWLPVGLIDAAGLIAGKEALRRLERLELGFLQHGHSDSDSAEEAGKRIGQQLYQSLLDLTRLTCLKIHFTRSTTSVWAWDRLAQLPRFPVLQELWIGQCHIWMEDLASFVFKHRHTMKDLRMFMVKLWDGSVDDIRNFIKGLQTFSNLEFLLVEAVWLDDDKIGFPLIFRTTDEEMYDEDDYVWVEISKETVFLDRREVIEGLHLMAECVTVTPG